jgi:hypothetical protein
MSGFAPPERRFPNDSKATNYAAISTKSMIPKLSISDNK